MKHLSNGRLARNFGFTDWVAVGVEYIDAFSI